MHGTAFALLMTINLPFLSTEHQSLNAQQQECFATSMIGYDYVINSRAGLPIEKALNTVSVDETSKIVRDTYKHYLPIVVSNAYQWQNSPHMYAIKVMHACSFNQGSKSHSH